jgi:hypothetical protein
MGSRRNENILKKLNENPEYRFKGLNLLGKILMGLEKICARLIMKIKYTYNNK